MQILVCGISGMIGHKMWQTLARDNAHTFGTIRGRRQDFAFQDLFGDRIIEHCDADNFESFAKALDCLRPSVILNCIGITKRKTEANDVERTFQVNARFPHQLALWAAKNKARVIHFSTDCVFDGRDGKYTERSVVTAPDLYGQTKYFGELDYEHSLTIRSSMIGWELSGHTELFEWFLAQRGKRITGYKNAWYSGLTTSAMSEIVRRIIWDHPELNGRYQIAGPVISKHDLLLQLKDAFGFEMEIVPDERFHCDRTLRSDKFGKATGITVPSWKKLIEGLVEERKFYEGIRHSHQSRSLSGAAAKAQ